MSAIVKSSGKETGRLKLNVTNIKSTLLKGSKTTANLANIKEKSIFKKKEAEKIRAEEQSLELQKPKKKIKPESSPIQGGSVLDKLIEAGILILGGFFANAIPELINALKEPFQKAMEFLRGIYDGLKDIFDWIMGGGAEEGDIESKKGEVNAQIAEYQVDKDEIESMSESGAAEYDEVESEINSLDEKELEDVSDEDAEVEDSDLEKDDSPDVEFESKNQEDQSDLKPPDAEFEPKDQEDSSNLKPVENNQVVQEAGQTTTEETKEAVVEGMKKDPEVQKLEEGGKSKQGAANETTNIKDSIPTLLSPGEYVLKAKIAKAIGYDVLDGVNGIGPSSGTKEKFKEISMLNKGKKNGKTVVVKQTQVVQTPVPV